MALGLLHEFHINHFWQGGGEKHLGPALDALSRWYAMMPESASAIEDTSQLSFLFVAASRFLAASPRAECLKPLQGLWLHVGGAVRDSRGSFDFEYEALCMQFGRPAGTPTIREIQ